VKLAIGVQARSASTRLPGKIYEEVEGRSILRMVYDACQAGGCGHPVFILGPEKDKKLEEFCEDQGMAFFAGHPDDLVTRYTQFVDTNGYGAVVRVTGDCPLIDPSVVAKCVELLGARNDYVSNTIYRTFPEGQDVQGCSVRALHWFDRHQKKEREHLFKPFDENMRTRESFVRSGMTYNHILNQENPILVKTSIDTLEELDRLRDHFKSKIK
jgi:spore coat polysaccharide biosynthesis protein SpsF